VRVVSFKVDDLLASLIEQEARRQGISKSELIRRALARYLFHDNEERRVIATRKVRIYL